MSRNTTSKIAIKTLLEQSAQALSHKEMQEKLDGLCDRVTVYRVLDRLVDEGFAHKIVDMAGVMRYAACHGCESSDHHHQHVHFNCTSCDAVMCLDKVEPAITLPDGYVTTEATYSLSGLCPKCS